MDKSKLGQELAGERQQQQALQEKLSASKSAKQSLAQQLLRTAACVKELKLQHTEVRSASLIEMRQYQDATMGPLVRAVKQLSQAANSMTDSFRQLQQERRRLHNLVLELKGNIRVRNFLCVGMTLLKTNESLNSYY